MTHHNVRGLSRVNEELSNTFDIYLKLFILLYADDTILCSDCPNDLQLQLDVFSDYCKQYKLKVNINKTKCMTFSKGRNPHNHTFRYNGENIENVCRYLNVQNTLSPKIHLLRNDYSGGNIRTRQRGNIAS